MTTSEITNRNTKTGVAAIVVDKLLVWRNTNNGPIANVMFAISNKNLR